MTFTREQFDSLGPFYVDDLAIDDSNQTFMYEIFNRLPHFFQGMVLMYGFQDTEVRDDLFSFLVERFFHLKVSDYYWSDIYKNYTKEKIFVDIDLDTIDWED